MTILSELVENFAKNNECEFTMLDSGYGGNIKAGPLTMNVMNQPGSPYIILQIAVAVLPDADAGRDDFLLKVLAANDLFIATHGMTLALNPDAELVTLLNQIPTNGLNQETFSNAVSKTFLEAAEWIKELDPAYRELSKNENENENESKESAPKISDTSNWIPL